MFCLVLLVGCTEFHSLPTCAFNFGFITNLLILFVRGTLKIITNPHIAKFLLNQVTQTLEYTLTVGLPSFHVPEAIHSHSYFQDNIMSCDTSF